MHDGRTCGLAPARPVRAHCLPVLQAARPLAAHDGGMNASQRHEHLAIIDDDLVGPQVLRLACSRRFGAR